MFWVPSISPSSLMFYNGDRFKGWKGSLFVGGLTNRSLIRVSFNQPSQAERREVLLGVFAQRIRDIVLDPNDPNVLVAWVYGAASAGNGGIYRSTDALAANPTFTQVVTTLTADTPGELTANHVGGGAR